MPGLITIALIILFGGALALLGDRVGMKVGKKRLSLFGLRPKYTSMIITVLTGFFIAGLTLTVLMSFSEYVRTALFKLHSIEQKLEVATRQGRELTGQVLQKQKQVVEKQREIQEKERQVLQKQREYAKLDIRYSKVKNSLNATVGELHQTQQDLHSNIHINSNLKQENQHLNNENSSLETNNEGLIVQNGNLTQISGFLKQKNNDLSVETERLNKQIQSLEGSMISLQDRTKIIEEKPLLFYVGEILISQVVEPGMKSDRVQTTVVNPLLQTANEIAVKQGAKIPGKANYALRVKPNRINEVCEQLATLNSKAVVRVVAENNSVKGEPVNVTVEVYPDEVIFGAGEKIVETELSTKQSESELRDRLLSLLILAYNKAIAKGIITDEQNLRNVISISEIANTIAFIKQHPDKVCKVSLVAEDEIRRTGKFQVKIQVKQI